MKREDAQIYIVAHRPVEYGLRDDALYTPIQVGFNERFLSTAVRDSDDPDNIAEWNWLYAEGTATYFIWKHCHPSKYKGQCQYRRRLVFDDDADFDELFNDCDVIVPCPLFFPNMTVRENYECCHSRRDIKKIEKIVKKLYPEYSESFDRVINDGHFLFYANGFLMRSEDYDRYAEFLFTVLGAFTTGEQWFDCEQAKERIDREIDEGERASNDGHIGSDGKGGKGYQRQVAAFLSERLLTLFVLHNFKPNRIKCVDYRKYEGI